MAKKVKSSQELPGGSWSPYSIPIHYSKIEYTLQNLTGKLLTIIDGSITNEKQNKAIKDQIKREFRDVLFRFQEKASDGKAGHNIKFPEN